MSAISRIEWKSGEMGVLAPTFSDVVIVLDSSAALSGVFSSVLEDYVIPCLEYVIFSLVIMLTSTQAESLLLYKQ